MTEENCENCDNVKCMDCRLRVIHDECVQDCPSCCPPIPRQAPPALSALLRDLEEPIVRAQILLPDFERGYCAGEDMARRSAAAALYRAMREDGLVD